MRVELTNKNSGELQSLMSRIADLQKNNVMIRISGSQDLVTQTFLLETIRANQQKYINLIKLNMKNIIFKKIEKAQLLNQLGIVVVKDLQKSLGHRNVKASTGFKSSIAYQVGNNQ